MKKSPGKGLNNSAVLTSMVAANDVPIPPFVCLKAEAAKLWPVYTRARMADDWRDFDLLLLAKLCNLEVDIRRNQAVLDHSKTLIPGPKGMPMEHPLIRVIDLLTRQQLSIMRVLSMSIPTNAPQTKRGHALQAKKFRHVIENDNEGLIARAS